MASSALGTRLTMPLDRLGSARVELRGVAENRREFDAGRSALVPQTVGSHRLAQIGTRQCEPVGDGIARDTESRAERVSADSVAQVEVEVADLVDAEDDGGRTSHCDVFVGGGDLLAVDGRAS